MRKLAVGVVIVCIALLLFWFLGRPDHADLVFLHGVVYTLDSTETTAEAIALRQGTIVGVGTTEMILKQFNADTVIELEGKPVYPGFVDAHAHLEGLGIALMTVDLSGVSSIEEVQRRVAGDIRVTEGRSWVRGRGWDQNRWAAQQFPTHRDLDAVSTTVPIFLVRIDGHAAWVNGKALALGGITPKTPDPSGGKILRDREGNPTGVLIDNAIDAVRNVMPKPTREERTRAVRLAVNACLRVGLTGVHDMGVDAELVDVYKELIQKEEFPFRVYAAIDGPGPTWDAMRAAGPILGFGDDRLTVRALKLYADGALGSRGAAMIEPYADDPGNRGITMMSSGAMQRAVLDAAQAGFQVCTHAIGDRGNAMTLDAYSAVLGSSGFEKKDLRLRIEHAQVLDPADVPRFAGLGVIPSMQPTHCTSDMPWATARLGEERARFAYAWRSLLDAGSIIPAGSDFPVEQPSPLLGFAAAVTRQDGAGHPEGGWHPEQRMTRKEALKGFTQWAAYAGFNEAVAGTIERGKRADLTILSKDIMTVPDDQLSGARVAMTVVAGRIVYRVEAPRASTR